MYQQAVDLLREKDEPLRLAHTIRHLGDVWCEEGDLDAAEECYGEALQIYRGAAGASVLDVANAVRAMAVLKDTPELWEQARQLYTTAGVKDGVANSCASLAHWSLRRGDQDRARLLLTEAEHAAEGTENAALLRSIVELRTTIGG